MPVLQTGIFLFSNSLKSNNMNLSTTGWNAFSAALPIDPLTIISNCQIGATPGVWQRSTNFLQTSWGTNTVGFTGNIATVISLNPTDASTTAWAAQWVVQTKMVNVGAAINPAVSKIAFAKAGQYWQNNIEIGFGATNWTNVQLSFRDNLGTSGAFAGSANGAVPVFAFAGIITGNLSLAMTIPTAGTYSLVLVMDNAGTFSTFEMEIVAM
jgi:hypothetical protein